VAGAEDADVVIMPDEEPVDCDQVEVKTEELDLDTEVTIVKREVKKEIEGSGDDKRDHDLDANDDPKNLFDEDSKDDKDWAPADAVKEENEMTEKLEREAAEEDKKLRRDLETETISAEERYKRLCNLLEKSEFYSKYLREKLENEGDESKKLKSKQLSNRKKRKLVSSGGDVGSPASKKRKKHVGRSFDGKDIIDDQPLLLSGGVMRDYQVKGYLWMATLWENGINGILADEMGLGKTIQTVALFCHLVEMGIPGPFLVVAPLSTIENWKREFERFAPSLPVRLYHGTKEERAEIRQGVYDKREIPELDKKHAHPTFITTYNIAMIDVKEMSRYHWKYIVVDEGHRLKNTNCKLMKELKLYNCSNRLLLTGTPLQNNLDELWSLLNFIMPEIFDDLHVFKAWFNPNEMDRFGKRDQEAERIMQQEQQNHILSTLHKILTPFLLRRIKTDVDLEIPPKKEVLVYCPLTDRQRELYDATLNKTLRHLVGDDADQQPEEEQADKSEKFGRGKRATTKVDYSVFLDESMADSDKAIEAHFEKLNKWQQMFQGESNYTAYGNEVKRSEKEVSISMRNTMFLLRKITNHPYMIEYPLTECGNFYRTDEQIVETCGKLKVLDQMLRELKKRGHKTLIFSQFGQLMLNILGDYLEHYGHKFSRLDGQMEFTARQENIDRFNNDPEVGVFLLSTRAGGLGINLTSADTIIIYDSDWNPQQDLQAQDRAHRIGQTKPVMVYRLVTANTIDEKIVERAAAKRKLEKLIIHQKKFKSQDMAGLNATMEVISPTELLALLNSKDHAGVVDRKDGLIFTKAELDALLDRSDLGWNKKEEKPGVKGEPLKDKSNKVSAETEKPASRRSSSRRGSLAKKTDEKPTTPAASAPLKTRAFKVIDTEGLVSGGLTSVKEN